MVNMLTSI